MIRRALIAIACASAVGAAPVTAEIIHVKADGTGDAPTIQAAFDIAVAGDVILVGPGLYAEHDILAKPLVSLRSEAGPSRTIISAEGGSFGICGEDPGAPAEISGFKIRKAGNAGIAFPGGGSQVVTDCVLHDNGVGFYGRNYHGLMTNITVVRSQKAEGHSGSGFSFNNADASMENCISAFNEGIGVAVWAGAGPDLSCCDVFGNDDGDFSGALNPIGHSGNISENPLFCAIGMRDLFLEKDSPCAPFTDPNPQCDLIGALPAGCPLAHSVVGLNGAAASPAWEPRAVILSASPNPCRAQTTLRVSTREAAATVVRIVDPAGRLVRSLRADAPSSGAVELLWDTTDASGSKVGSGVYYAIVRRGSVTHRRALVVLR